MMFLKTGYTALLITLGFAFTTGSLKSQQREEGSSSSGVSISAETDLCSRYYYKGVLLSSGAVLQPAIYLSVENFSAGIWGSFGRNEDRSFRLCETDVYASHEFTISELTFNNKFAVYLYPEAEGYPSTGEYILSCSMSKGRVTAFTEFSLDLISDPGSFVVTHGAVYNKELLPGIELEGGLNISWAGSKYNGINYEIEKAALNCVQADISFMWSMPAGQYLRPHLHYFYTIDKELRQGETGGQFYFGLMAGYNL